MYDYHIFRATRTDVEFLDKFVNQINANGWETVQLLPNGYQSTLVLARRPRGAGPPPTTDPRPQTVRPGADKFTRGALYVMCFGCQALSRTVNKWERTCTGCGQDTIRCNNNHCSVCGKDDRASAR